VKKLSEEEQKQIVADCVADKNCGWEALMRHYRPFALWVASSKFRLSKDQSEDIAQLTMVGVCKAIRNGKVRSLEAYVPAIARNKCIDLLRKNDPLRNISTSPDEENDAGLIPDWREIPLEIAESEAFCVLRHSLESMDSPCDKLLTVRYREEASYEEIAKQTSIPVTQVGTRIKRCLKTLRRILEQERPALMSELEALVV
jgi:RNA polymerase sigma factor (sigma-70 family)